VFFDYACINKFWSSIVYESTLHDTTKGKNVSDTANGIATDTCQIVFEVFVVTSSAERLNAKMAALQKIPEVTSVEYGNESSNFAGAKVHALRAYVSPGLELNDMIGACIQVNSVCRD
jgi:hypothetical protein